MDPLEVLADSVLGHGLVQSIGNLLTLGARDNSPLLPGSMVGFTLSRHLSVEATISD
jgi:hypothetical protein